VPVAGRNHPHRSRSSDVRHASVAAAGGRFGSSSGASRHRGPTARSRDGCSPSEWSALRRCSTARAAKRRTCRLTGDSSASSARRGIRSGPRSSLFPAKVLSPQQFFDPTTASRALSFARHRGIAWMKTIWLHVLTLLGSTETEQRRHQGTMQSSRISSRFPYPASSEVRSSTRPVAMQSARSAGLSAFPNRTWRPHVGKSLWF
jgi:hypothetical protein